MFEFLLPPPSTNSLFIAIHSANRHKQNTATVRPQYGHSIKCHLHKRACTHTYITASTYPGTNAHNREQVYV